MPAHVAASGLRRAGKIARYSVVNPGNPAYRKSASSETMTSAFANRIASQPADRTPASRLRAHCRDSPARRHATWLADKLAETRESDRPASARKSSGVRMRMPAPAMLSARSAARASLSGTSPHELTSPLWVTFCERSGSYIPSIDACEKISVPPSSPDACHCLQSWWDETVAFDQQRDCVSAQRECRGIKHRPARNHFFRLLARKERSVPSAAWCRPSCPPCASDAPINFRNPRRETESSHSDAPLGNSRCIISWNSALPASSSRLRQYSGPWSPRSGRWRSPDPACPSCWDKLPLGAAFRFVLPSSSSSSVRLRLILIASPPTLPMTRGATGNVSHRAQVVLLHQIRAQRHLVGINLAVQSNSGFSRGRLLVAHIENLVARTQIFSPARDDNRDTTPFAARRTLYISGI